MLYRCRERATQYRNRSTLTNGWGLMRKSVVVGLSGVEKILKYLFCVHIVNNYMLRIVCQRRRRAWFFYIATVPIQYCTKHIKHDISQTGPN
jgi:hypothetical protein